MPRPRWLLHAEAQLWRTLMSIGMTVHKLNSPPPYPFTQRTLTIPTTLSTPATTLPLTILTPPHPPPHACILNFHGGGFTLGSALDDLYFLSLAAHRLNALIITPSYRRAPEHPFPTAVLDAADTLLWTRTHADTLHINPQKIALLGWSAGGNMVFSAALRAHHEMPGELAACVAFYPSTDFTAAREERRASNVRPDMELPALFTRLFDASYLWPPEGVRRDSPYLSPGCAEAGVLREGLPREVLVVWCEWDELRAEAERFVGRLRGLGKRVWEKGVKGRWHAWDKSPWGVDEVAKGVYEEVVGELGRVFARAAGEAEGGWDWGRGQGVQEMPVD